MVRRSRFLLVGCVVTSAALGVWSLAVPRRDSSGSRRAEVSHAPDGGSGSETQTINRALDWYYGQRMVPGRRLPEGARQAAVAQARAVPRFSDSGAAPAIVPAWSNIGPAPIDSANALYDGGSVARDGWGNVAGRVTSIAVEPGSNQIAYAGGADGGVWKTVNGGTTWTPVADGLDSLAIGAISISATAPSTVWVGTGEAATSFDSYYGSGIYRSLDGGATWSKRGGATFDQATVYRIVLGAGKNVLAATNHGLYRSIDAGKSWSRVLAPGGTTDPYANFVTDVSYVPHTKNTHVLAAVGWRGGDTSNGLWLSVDSGATFNKVAPTGFAPQANIGRTSLALTATAEYAVVQDAALYNSGSATDGLNGVYRSLGGPAGPWTKIATGTGLRDANSQISSCYGENPGVQSWYNQYLTVDPSNSNHVVLGLEEIYDSTDGGTSWHSIGRYSDYCAGATATTHPDQHAAAFAVVGGVPTIYVGNDGGVWKQTGPGLSNSNWVNLNTNLSLTQPYYAAASAGPNPVIVAGTQDNGTVQYSGSSTWAMTRGGDGGGVAIEPATPTHSYEEYVYLLMTKTSDGGQHWSGVAPPDAGNGNTARFIAPFMLDPTDKNHLVALGQHVWESHSGIATTSWSNAFDNGTGHLGTALDVQGTTTYEGWCGPCNPNTLDNPSPFARGLATNQGGVWHSVTATGLPNRYVSGILIDPADPTHVYVALSGFSRRWIPGGGLGHVFESTNAGSTFTDISSNLPDAPANDLVLSKGKLVVATDVGVFKRTATGSWGRFGTAMPTLSVLDLSIVPGGSEIVAATHGRGVWTLTP